jgi:glycosyltransferase involved in cell wall biosynthesis
MGALTVVGPFRGASGYDHHVREFVRHLARRGVRQQLIDLPEWGSAPLPPELRDPWFDALGAPVPSKAVLHFCMPHQVRPARGKLTLNHTMFEASRIPAVWVRHGRLHDLVLVPTDSSRLAWIESGCPEERIRLCPLGVDAEQFRPGHPALDLKDRQGQPVARFRTRVLNISELGPRKNLIALLRVWIRTTTPRDDAILIVKVRQAFAGANVGLMRDLDTVERALGKSRRDAAPVLFVERVFADAEMPRLYAAATHYWSMSRGEGWDQPMMEAGASGLRLLAPAHSAYTAYLDASVARMLPARRVPVPAGRECPNWMFEGAEWWEPDEDAAAEALREALGGHDGHRASARARLAAEFTWERAAARLITVLEEAHAARGRRF